MRSLLHFFWTFLLGIAVFGAVFGGQSALAAEADVQSVTLRWGKVRQVIKYRLQIARDSKFQDVVVDVQSRTPRYQWEEAIPGRYFWRVQGFDRRERPGRWSKPGQLIIDSEAVKLAKEAAAKEAADKEAAAKEAAAKEAADKEAADKEAADKEAADKEAADKEAADKEALRKSQYQKGEFKDPQRHLALFADLTTDIFKVTGPGFHLRYLMAPVDFLKSTRPSFRFAYSSAYSTHVYQNAYGASVKSSVRNDILKAETLLIWEKRMDDLALRAGAGGFLEFIQKDLGDTSERDLFLSLMGSASLSYSLDIFNVVFELSSHIKEFEPQTLILPSKDLRWSLGLEIPLY